MILRHILPNAMVATMTFLPFILSGSVMTLMWSQSTDSGGLPRERWIVGTACSHHRLAWVHPFVDGNGRTARALFYWSMLKSGYWLSEYVSISSVLKKSQSAYVRAYLHSESDGSDMTYFIGRETLIVPPDMPWFDRLRERLEVGSGAR